MWLRVVLWMVLLAALILWPAGTLAYPGGWAVIALFTLSSVPMLVWLAKHSPSLLRERMASPIQRAQKPWDRVFMLLFLFTFLGGMAFMARDAARAGFTAVPVWLQALGGAGIVICMVGAWWTLRENAFAAPVVKTQEGQRVIDTGPYAVVRHPMYASSLLFFIGLPLLLGSWRGLAFSAFFILAIGWRAVQEERTLRTELQGYEDYTVRVCYRFIPFVW